MSQLNPSEISSVLKEKIAGLDLSAERKNEGIVVSVSDGIVRIHGMGDVMYGEVIEFENGTKGMALNLEQDSVGAVVLGDYLEIIEVFKREFKKDKIIDINYFLTDEFSDLKDDIIDLSANKYEISKQWRDKFNIHVSEETDSLKKTTYTNILRLKFRLIRKMINDNMQNLNTSDKVNIDEETIKLHNKLKSAEIDIAKKLGNVTSV